MSVFLQDVRYSFRNLLSHPGFAVITIATIALVIGANSAIFSVIHAVLLEPLPYPDPRRLYRVFYSSAEYPHFPMNPSGFLDYRQRNHVFESMGVFTRQNLQLSGYDRPQL